jgi:disulfide bond formation protein DsbB
MGLRKMTLVVAAALLVGLVAGCGNGGKESGGTKLNGDPVKGQVAFESTCISCHGNDGQGLPGSGKNLVKKSDWMKKQDDAALLAFVKTGRPTTDPLNTTQVDMPPRGGNPALTDEDLTNIIAYVRSLQAKAGEK